MKAISNFLQKHRSKNEWNFISKSPQGKYAIPHDQAVPFFALWVRAVREMSPINHIALTYKPPHCAQKRLDLDIDLRYLEERKHDDSGYIEVGMAIAKKLSDARECPIEFMVVMKERGYFKKENVFALGCHLVFPDVYVSASDIASLRKFSSELCRSQFQNQLPSHATNGIVDRMCSGLFMIGCFKGEKAGGRYCVRYTGCYNDGEQQINGPFEEHDFLGKLSEEIMKSVYGFIWNKPDQKKTTNAGKPPIPLGDSPIDWPYYFKITNQKKPPHNDRCKLIWYMRQCGVRKEEFSQIQCGPVKKRLPRSGRTGGGESLLTDRTLIALVTNHAEVEWSVQKLFVRPMYYFDAFQFAKGIHTREEINQYIGRAIQYSCKEKQFIWRLKQTHQDRNGNRIVEIQTMFHKEAPFTGSDDFKMQFYPDIKKIREILERRMERILKKREGCEGKSTMVERIEEILNNELDVRAVCTEFEIEPEQVPMGVLVKTAQREFKLDRYRQINFKPYPGPNDEGADPLEYNTFVPFPMHAYIPSQTIDFKTTIVWEYLTNCWGFGEEGPRLLDFNKRIAYLVQFPHIRSESITCLISKAQGNGKSTVYFLISKLLGNTSCKFHHDVSTYMPPRFNITNASKLLHFCDDVLSATRTQTRRLFPEATGKVKQYEGKGNTPITLNEYHSLWLTSNNKRPILGSSSPHSRSIRGYWCSPYM